MLFLITRLNSIINGTSTPIDIKIFLIWIALLLVPIFEEISLFGIKLKREIDNLRTDLTGQILSLRTDIQNSIDFKTEIKPNFYLHPPADEQLSKIEEFKEVLDKALKDKGIVKPEYPDLDVSEEIKFLFSVRYQIEKELRRIYDSFLEEKHTRPYSTLQMTRILESSGMTSSKVLE